MLSTEDINVNCYLLKIELEILCQALFKEVQCYLPMKALFIDKDNSCGLTVKRYLLKIASEMPLSNVIY